MRYTLRLYKGLDAEQFRAAVESCARALGASLTWGVKGTGDADFRYGDAGIVHAIDLPYQSGQDFVFCKALGHATGLPWIELRIQEGTLWDYALYQGCECIDTFSVCPQCWADPPQVTAVMFGGGTIKRFVSKLLGPRRYRSMEERLLKWQGKPDVLAAAWGLPRHRIERYLVNWGYKPTAEGTFNFQISGKAYPDDKYEYGQYGQFFDVLRALGAVEPMELHTLVLPKPRRG